MAPEEIAPGVFDAGAIQSAREAAWVAQRRDAGLEPTRSTYYSSWVVERTGGIARYIHGPAGRPVIYYKGPCQDCGCEFVTERTPRRNKVQGNGRWPSYCRACSGARIAADNAAAKERMAKLRAERNKLRDENYRRLGRPLPEPGKRGRPKGSRNL